MPVKADPTQARFTLSGADFEPEGDESWDDATPSQRKAYWGQVKKLTIVAKRQELAAGIGVNGRRLKKVKYPRPDGATGPPLSPHQVDSRHQKWLRATATAKQVSVTWGREWAKIVQYHRRGAGYLPVRNVVGLTKASQKSVAKDARVWWAKQHPVEVVYVKGTKGPAISKGITVFTETDKPRFGDQRRKPRTPRKP